jgi:hypothetical protein
VRGERAQENDPPLSRRQQEQRGEQDRIRRPQGRGGVRWEL